MEFGVLRSVVEKASDPIIHVIRNCRIRHFIKEGGMSDSDCVEGLAKGECNDTNIGWINKHGAAARLNCVLGEGGHVRNE